MLVQESPPHWARRLSLTWTGERRWRTRPVDPQAHGTWLDRGLELRPNPIRTAAFGLQVPLGLTFLIT